MITISLLNQSCYRHEITLIPDFSPSIPLKFRRIDDYYIISIIKVNSNQSLTTKTKWTIINCTTNKSFVIYVDKITRDFTEIYIPSNILPYGIYKFILTVTMIEYPYLSKSESALVQINQSGITPHRIPPGKSLITHQYQQENHSIDLDEYTFNPINSNYKLYDLYNIRNSFLTNIKYLKHKLNSSSSLNRSDNGTIWKSNHHQSSITILAASLLSNQTQQFMDHMEYIRDATLQATGYNLTHIQHFNISIVIIGSVIWRICSSSGEYELINRRSEFGLYSRSEDNYSRIEKLRWNIYYASPISSSNINPPILFPQMNRYKNIDLFGRNPTYFPSVNQLFLSQPEINRWRSQVVDTFQHGISLTKSNFEMNSKCSNESCLIHSININTIALLNITSSDWSNNYNFKDYALYYCVTNTNKLLIITFSLTSQIEVRLVNGKVDLIVHIQDILNCITEMNLSLIDVLSHPKHIFNLIKTNNNPFMDWIFATNQDLIRIILTSILQEYYQTNNETFDNPISNTILTTSISLSSLEYQYLTQKNSDPFNKSTLVKFNKELNLPSNFREFLSKFTTNCIITSLSNKSFQLLQSLYSISDTIPYEDLLFSTNQFIQCVKNIISVVSKTNRHQSECFSTDLTKYADGLSNGDFVKNNSICLLVISVSTISMILIISERFNDKKDLEKLRVTSLSANDQSDKSSYEIVVLNDQRKDWGTKSRVHFVLYDDKVIRPVRILDDYQRKIFQDGTIYAFITALPNSLTFVNCIRICDENSVEDSSLSSCFFKYKDLQTMDKFRFIPQRWFALEKIEDVLPVASEIDKVEFCSVLSKRVSDGPLWFSIFSRPSCNLFPCVETFPCCFVLLFISIFLNLIYYDLSNQGKLNNSKENVIFSFFGVCLSHDQILIVLTIGLFLLIPCLLLVQIFRRIRSRHRRISPLEKTFQKMKTSSKFKNANEKKRKSLIRFPWWCLFVICGLCLVLIGVCIPFVIVRGIEFGDLKSYKWLRSILSGLFSSIVVSEPLKILSLSIFFVCFCLNSSNDKESIDENPIDLNKNEEYLHSNQKVPLFIVRPVLHGNCLNEDCVRYHRLKQFYMCSILRQLFIYLCFVSIVCVIIYSNRHSNSYLQLENFRNYFLHLRQMDNVACPCNATLR